MCGLTLSISLLHSLQDLGTDSALSPTLPHDTDPSILDSLRATSARRGPDASGVYSRIIPVPAGYLCLTLSVSVLGLRGALTPQPIVTTRGVLGWNGQAFSGLDVDKDGGNDTRALARRLQAGHDIEDVLSEIEGPFAFIFFDLETNELTFAVDPLSRRSLQLHTKNGQLFLASATSREARQAGLEFRALGGGEYGMLQLNDLALDNQGNLDFGQAIDMRKSSSRWPWETIDAKDVDNEDFDVATFIDKLSASVRRRVENIPPPLKGYARVAVLFSGGVDCTLLACLTHRFVPIDEPIELVNVAFGYASENFDVPDRLSARQATAELRQACHGRRFELVEINIPQQEGMAHRQNVVDLMYPCDSEMDLSLAFPLYFASRGIGKVQTETGWKDHHVTSKVYISGLGADEQLGGYGRHRKAYERGDHQALVDELQLDLTRLPTRNLSRDDRILSSHARDARYPYLDLEFVTYLSSLPASTKCDLRLSPGTGDKRLLRLAAAECGLLISAGRVKRAMQFGTRSAKLGPSLAKGQNASARSIQST